MNASPPTDTPDGPTGMAPPTRDGRPHVVFALVGDVRLSSRALRQLRALRAMDATVEILTLGPAPDGPLLAEGLPLGPGLRVQTLPTPSGSGPRFFWAAHRRFRAAAMRTPAALYLASDLYTLPGLADAARRWGGRVIFDSRELYAHLDSSAGRPWVRAVWTAIERRAIHRADAVFTVNKSIAERLARTYSIPLPLVLHNVPAQQSVPVTDRLRDACGIAPGRRIVLYQGLLREGRGLRQLITAMEALPEADLVMIGDGPMADALTLQAAVLGPRAHFLGFIPPDQLLAYTAGADLGVLLIEPLTESLRLALPNKLFEYLMAGLPVLASPGPEMRRVVETYEVGLIADPDTPHALITALRHALTDETARARWRANMARALNAYAWEPDAVRFRQTILDLLQE